jgi:hypothetical protein
VIKLSRNEKKFIPSSYWKDKVKIPNNVCSLAAYQSNRYSKHEPSYLVVSGFGESIELTNSLHLFEIKIYPSAEKNKLVPLSDKIIRYEKMSPQDHSN